ncbi:MAG: heavy metal translocating P-type ATPase metal-binding domain-containing protein, partial [Alphaproteobacteria bacterium]|nr:heavy metal translocating P-type ATPase metal-binding domain-containing protein [Alphaproteobacteria bacterium]
MVDCAHCGSQVPPGSADEFCCRGCRAAFDLVKGSGLAQYYRRRCVDPEQRPLRPEADAAILDFTAHVFAEPDGARTLHLMVEGLHCAACVWLIESLIGRQPQVEAARVNMTTRRLVVTWRGDEALANDLLAPVLAVGYRLVPFDPARLKDESLRHEKELLRAMAVAGFAAGNVMLFSVSVWAGMDSVTRDFFHWISAAIALPAILYCVRPFLRSALTALRAKRTNMDVPISIGVVLTAGMSLHETMNSGPHAYFDAAISLLFFLLVGRYLDSRARGRARASAEHLLSLGATAVTVVEQDGTRRMVPPAQVATGAIVIVAAGERIGVDGRVIDG